MFSFLFLFSQGLSSLEGLNKNKLIFFLLLPYLEVDTLGGDRASDGRDADADGGDVDALAADGDASGGDGDEAGGEVDALGGERDA